MNFIYFTKCAWMNFHGKNKVIPPDIPDLFLNGLSIERVHDFKYIGLNLDNTLCWTKHINEVCSRLNRFFSIFRYLRDKIPFHLKRQIFLTTVSPIINYGIELYGSSTKNNISKLQSKQNQLLKVLFNKDWFYNTNLLHKEGRLLKVNDLHSLRILTFVRKCLNKETIPLFHEYFTLLHENHDHDTRNDLLTKTIRSQTAAGDKRIKSVGSILWNQSYTARKYLNHTIETYKHKLKDYFIDSYST